MTSTDAFVLADLVAALQAFAPRVHGDGNPHINDVVQDSRAVAPGALFVARRGETTDGASFISGAVEAGAVALLVEHGTTLPRVQIPVVSVSDARRALGFAAEAVFGEASRELSLVGITGTNGKTTTCSLLRQCLVALGHPTAQIGTLGFEFDDRVLPGSLTTPEADAVSRFLRSSRNAGATHAAMEVSSHALAQGRVDALCFDVAAFSNLSQDHLDYHGSMEAYGAAKARLFTELAPRLRVINCDDPFGARLAEQLGDVVRVGRGADAEVRLRRVEAGPHSTCLEVQLGSRSLSFETRLVGQHNVDNWLLTLAIARCLGVDLGALPEVSSRVSAAPGRMERCERTEDDITVLVDYAHTEDALSRALTACRSLTDGDGGRLWCVFGCGGDRDPGKRSKMGAVAGRLADVTIVTNDNPRTEDPAAIAQQIEAGMLGAPGAYSVQLDRERAIVEAVTAASPRDVVLIAGKGHEDYQLIGQQRFDFDDRNVARRALAIRRQARRSG